MQWCCHFIYPVVSCIDFWYIEKEGGSGLIMYDDAAGLQPSHEWSRDMNGAVTCMESWHEWSRDMYRVVTCMESWHVGSRLLVDTHTDISLHPCKIGLGMSHCIHRYAYPLGAPEWCNVWSRLIYVFAIFNVCRCLMYVFGIYIEWCNVDTHTQCMCLHWVVQCRHTHTMYVFALSGAMYTHTHNVCVCHLYWVVQCTCSGPIYVSATVPPSPCMCVCARACMYDKKPWDVCPLPHIDE